MEPFNSSGSRHVVALPYAGRGHINPMLNLCRRLTSRTPDILISVVVTEEWLTLLASTPLPPNTRFRAIPNVLPSEHARGANFEAFTEAVMTKMEGPVEELLGEEKVDAIIADSVLPWAPAIASRRGVPVYSFFTQSAGVFLALHRLGELDVGGPSEIDLYISGEGNECLKYTPRNFTRSPTGSNEETIPRRIIQIMSWYSTAQGVLFSSFNDLESDIFTILKSKLSVLIYPVGPCIPYETTENKSNSDYFKWLDSQQKGSVLFIFLGSFLPIAGDQITEMATGLKISGIPFLWTARGETQRIEELSGDKGFVVPWCDQLTVLCHPSLGGFLSHCRWNSTMEAVYARVPMLTFPLIWDQYPNSDMVVDEWKKGFTLQRVMEAGSVVGREKIAMSVRKLMGSDSKDGKEARRRAKDLGEMCGKALEENGSSFADIDACVKVLLQA